MSNDPTDFDDTFLYELARERQTSELVAYMKRGDDPQVRARAAELLGDFSDVQRQFDEEEVLRELINVVLDEDNDEVRARAIDSLYRHGQEPLERLISYLSDFDAKETPDWVTAQKLVEWLDHEYPEFRMVAATALGEIGDEHAVSHLLDGFDDLDPRVRVRAVRACGVIGDERAVEPVAQMLEDSNARVRRAAANALASIGTEDALKRLIPVARADDPQLRQIAVAELDRLGSIEPMVVLVRALEDRSELVQRAAILSLIELMHTLADEDDDIRQIIAKQFRQADSDELIPLLLDVLAESPRMAVQQNAVWLLGRVIDPDDEAAPRVHDALIDVLDSDGLADLAQDSLIRLESDELEKTLQIFIQSEGASSDAIERAEAVLDEIGTEQVSEVVRNSVDYTYVRDPADYTRKKRQDESNEN